MESGGMSVLESENQEIEDEGFYFESEEMALKNNHDYHALMKTIAILQAQRAKVLKDIDKLANMRAEALQNPQDFLDKLVRKESLEFPERLDIAAVPKIDFSKYKVQPLQLDGTEIQKITGNHQLDADNEDDSDTRVDLLKSNAAVRLWTVDEQKRLEELLVQYPPEPIERRRFEKIARALGNRTTQQVASRCQKYFKKLQRAGLPIPGRYPKGCQVYRQSNKMRCFNGRKSTFFPDFDVPVRMNEEEDDSWLKQSSVKSPQDDEGSSRDEEKYTTVDDTDDEECGEDTNAIAIKLARRIRAEKEKDLEDRPSSLHFGFKCDICQEDPIRGTRWHCKVCEKSTDYCSDCLFTQLIQPNLRHPPTHKFIAFRVNHTTKK